METKDFSVIVRSLVHQNNMTRDMTSNMTCDVICDFVKILNVNQSNISSDEILFYFFNYCRERLVFLVYFRQISYKYILYLWL